MIRRSANFRLSWFFLLVLLGCLAARSSAEEVLYEQKILSDSLPIIVPVNFDGETISMMLDTCASVHSVDTSMQPHLHHYLQEKAAAGTDSEFKVKVWESPAMSIGEWKLPHASVMTIDFAAIRSALGLNIRGVLGKPAMEDVAVEMDFDTEKLRLLRDYTPPASTSLFMPGGRLKGWNYVPMDPDQFGLPFARIEIGGITIRANVDTGALSCVMLRKETFDRLVANGTIAPEAESDSIKSATAGGVVTNREGKFTSGNVLGIDLRGVPVEESKNVDILGLRFLQHFNFVCDVAGRRLCFQQRHAEPPLDPYEMIGAGFIYPEGHCRITELAKSGPAQDAGLRKDDALLKFGPLQEKDLNRLSVYEFCETSAGQTVDVEYSRAGKEEVLKTRLQLRQKRFLFPPQP